MSIVLPLDEEQRDALQELLNISMGQAANSLAQLIETKIDISIPKIYEVNYSSQYVSHPKPSSHFSP